MGRKIRNSMITVEAIRSNVLNLKRFENCMCIFFNELVRCDRDAMRRCIKLLFFFFERPTKYFIHQTLARC
ncbi:hypothetical protein HanHA89_Chr11g0440581 [Helianthus annuus]|nr:hypothetical protein HanHA89_Chr11g0440581 [Helianthus annuus]